VILTVNEKRDLVKLIEADKPLPEEFRFKLFGDKREVELVWNGKNQNVSNVVLPFQTIEQVDEPREEKPAEGGVAEPQSGYLFDDRGRQQVGWVNKLIWGDNKLVLSSLKNGPLREEIEEAGGLKLIYIDPPFDVGADFSMDIPIGSGDGGAETFTKKPNVLEQIAYSDTWGKGSDSFIAMIYERLILMRDLLADDGSIYVHCDWRVNSYLRLVLDEIFGKDNFVNEIIWYYKTGGMPEKLGFGKKHDNLLFYSKKIEETVFNMQKEKSYLMHKYGFKGVEILQDRQGQYTLVNCRDVFDIPALRGNQPERLDYPTQKPEALLERIIKASSNEGDLVADFFCGSGTAAAVAEKLNRKWIAADLGKFAIHTTRKRMISVQRELKAGDKNYRAFVILNLGKYERQHYIGINPNLSDEQQQQQIALKSRDYQRLILRAYTAQAVNQSGVFHGKKPGAWWPSAPLTCR